MKKLFPLTILLLLTGCIADPAYDLSKLDTEMTVLKNAEFRIPDTGFFSLDDFFSLQGIDYLVTDENGDYRIRQSDAFPNLPEQSAKNPVHRHVPVPSRRGPDPAR